MRDVRIPVPNPAIADIALSTQMRRLMQERAEMAQAIYLDQVAKRTGRLAKAARVETFIGGANKDRWCGRLIIDDIGYVLPHEFGVGEHPGSTGEGAVQEAANDLNQVLNQLGALL
jgi:hypothetical protein